MTKDWRAENAEGLRGQPLRFKVWKKASETWDHDHCVGCWAKFAEFDGPEILKAGFATTESYARGAEYDWVCETCFNELKAELGWFQVE